MATVDLSEIQPGASATIRDTVPWGLLKRFASAGEDAVDEMVKRMVTEWHVLDAAGNPLPHPKDADLDEVDARIVGKIASAASETVQAQTPKEIASSSTSSPEEAAPTAS